MRATSVTTGEVRLSYPNLFTPKATQLTPDPRFSCDLLIPKTDAKTLADIQAAMKAAIEEGKDKTWGGQIPKSYKTPIKDGDESDDPNYKGHWILHPWSKAEYPPKVMDGQLNPIIDQSEIYGGVYARVNINFYIYNSNGVKGVGCGFDAGVVKTRDGEPFGGGRTSAEDAFGAPAQTAGQAINPLTGMPY